MNSEIHQVVEHANLALERLNILVASDMSDITARTQAEYDVHLATRVLYCRFSDVVLWRGGGYTAEERQVLENIFLLAATLVSLDAGCIKSVNDRLRDFNRFVQFNQLVPNEF